MSNTAGCNIAEVLDLSVREAFAFFRGHRKILADMKCLMDVGLDYLRLGPAGQYALRRRSTATEDGVLHCSRRGAGEPCSSSTSRPPGLHLSDVLQLLDCFDSLIDLGHSLVVVDHNLLIMQAADWIDRPRARCC